MSAVIRAATAEDLAALSQIEVEGFGAQPHSSMADELARSWARVLVVDVEARGLSETKTVEFQFAEFVDDEVGMIDIK